LVSLELYFDKFYELDLFKSIEHLNELLFDIRNLQTEMETTFQSYFKLNEEEKAVFNQYDHAFDRVKRSQNRSGSVYLLSLQHSARLLTNYISYLIKRFIADQITFDNVQSEAEFLIMELRGLDDVLSENVRNVMKQYRDFRELDEVAVIAQDKTMEKAMVSAHVRATEGQLERIIRHIRESILVIKKLASEKINKAWELSFVLASPITHPVESYKNLCQAVVQPIETAKEIWKWAKKSPWKTAFLLLGTGFIGFPLIFGLSTVIAAGGVLRVREEESKEIKLKEREVAEFKSKNDEEARKIAEEIKMDKLRRQRLKEARESVEEEIRQQKLNDEQNKRIRDAELNAMNINQLNQKQAQLENDAKYLGEHLKDTKEILRKHHEENVKTQKDISLVHEGRAAAARLVQTFAQNSQQ
jgi:hypothetical protein